MPLTRLHASASPGNAEERHGHHQHDADGHPYRRDDPESGSPPHNSSPPFVLERIDGIQSRTDTGDDFGSQRRLVSRVAGKAAPPAEFDLEQLASPMHPDLHGSEADASAAAISGLVGSSYSLRTNAGSIGRRKLFDEPIEALTHFLSEHAVLTVGREVCGPLLTVSGTSKSALQSWLR